MDAVKLRIALIDYFSILILKCPVPEAPQSVRHSTNNEISDDMAEAAETF